MRGGWIDGWVDVVGGGVFFGREMCWWKCTTDGEVWVMEM